MSVLFLVFYFAKHKRNKERERKDIERKEARTRKRREKKKEKEFRALFLKNHLQIQNLKDLSFLS